MSSTEPLYLVFLVAGFTVGFGHCIGMCGPIVVSLSLNSKESHLVFRHLLYNGGRVITYGILGGLAGTLGSFTILASSIQPAKGSVDLCRNSRLAHGPGHGRLASLRWSSPR